MAGYTGFSKEEVLAAARDLQEKYGDFTSLDVWFRLPGHTRRWHRDRHSEMTFISSTLLKNGAKSCRKRTGRRRYHFEAADD